MYLAPELNGIASCDAHLGLTSTTSLLFWNNSTHNVDTNALLTRHNEFVNVGRYDGHEVLFIINKA